MLMVRTDQARLFLTADLLARDGIDSPTLAKHGFTVCEKIQRFQPVEDLVPALDRVASFFRTP
jgi:hypothetical protein